MDEISELPTPSRERPKTKYMSVRVSTQGEKMASSRVLQISLCHCLLHVFVDQVYFLFEKYISKLTSTGI